MRRKSSIRATAYHEAGHAIVALALDWPVDGVTICRTGRYLEENGTKVTGVTGQRPPAVLLGLRDGATEADITDDMTVALVSSILITLAGDVAHLRHLAKVAPEKVERFSKTGVHHILWFAARFETERLVGFMSETRDLVVGCWPAIERMADVLVERDLVGVLDEDEWLS